MSYYDIDTMTNDDPKKLLRCPNGCGVTVNFTAIYKCCVCGKIICEVCRKPINGKSYCKKDWREELNKRSRGL